MIIEYIYFSLPDLPLLSKKESLVSIKKQVLSVE